MTRIDLRLWRTTHRAFGAALVGAGIVTLVIALAAPRYSLLMGLALLVSSCVVAFVRTRGTRGTMSTTLAARLAIVLGPTMGDGQSMAAHSPAAVIAPSTVTEEVATFERTRAHSYTRADLSGNPYSFSELVIDEVRDIS